MRFDARAEEIGVPVGLQVGRQVNRTLLAEVAREGILKSLSATVRKASFLAIIDKHTRVPDRRPWE
jgi:hypothetical protein